MQKLAREFGLSDVGLAKLCRRHNIPVPGRGYWARIQCGQKLRRISLPALKEPRLEIVRIFPSCTKATTVDDSVNEEVFPTIEVKNDRPITHPVARRIERSMSRKPIDERGILSARQGRSVPLKISAETLPRALRLLDALFAALDGETCVFEWPSPYDKPLKIAVCGDK